MKKFIILLAFILVFVPLAHAKTYVIITTATNEITSISPDDDAVLEAGQTKLVLDREYETLALDKDVQDYKYLNGNFVENIQKISDRENTKIINNEKQAEFEEVRKAALKAAFTELKKVKTFKHLKDSDFE